MMTVEFPGKFDAVVAFYSIFHLPREEQGVLVQRVEGWLKDGGVFLGNVGTKDGEFWREDWFRKGVRMRSFGLGVQGNRDVIRDSGLVLEEEVAVEKVGKAEETFHWIFARKDKGMDIEIREMVAAW